MLPKWLLFFAFILVLALSSIDGQPTPTSIVKRQESDVIDYHRTGITRTSTQAPTETSSAGKGDKNDKNNKGDDSKNNGSDHLPKPIPAQTAPWFGK